MKDSTRHHLREWGYEHEEIDEIAQMGELDVEIDLLILAQVTATNRKVVKLMADISKLEEAINSLQGTEESVLAAVTDLKDEIANLEAGTISQEQVDSLTAKVNTAVTALAGAVTTPPAEEPPVEPPAEETPPAE